MISPDELQPGIFKKVPQKPSTVFSGAFCEWCGSRISDGCRGLGKKFCDETCRNAFLRRIYRFGRKVFESRKKRRLAAGTYAARGNQWIEFLAVVRELALRLKEGGGLCGT